jgi:hypothetical protein
VAGVLIFDENVGGCYDAGNEKRNIDETNFPLPLFVL